jgi:hypothetical protein
MKQASNFADSLIGSAIENVQADAVNEMLDKYGLNWNVKKEGLYLPGNIETSFFGIVREDTNNCFQTCKGSYVPYQNKELAELVYRIGEKTGYEIHKGGMFNGGAKVYIQLETGIVNGIGENKDSIKKYVTAINSHDGSTSLRWGHTNITISCLNTFNAAYRDVKNSARHTQSIQRIVEQSLMELEALEKVEKSIFDTYFKLAETPVKKVHIEDIVLQTIDVDISVTKDVLEKEYSTYRLNQMHELLACIQKEMKQKGETLWGLFSGVTNYTTHKMSAPKRDNGRLESKYVGEGFRVDNDVFDVITTKFLS